MMYWVISLHVIILSTINIKPMSTQNVRSVCVKPMLHDYNDAVEDSCEKWFSNTSSPERYFTSNTNIKLLPGIYHLNSTYHLSISRVINFSIAGSEANKTAVIIKCFRNQANDFVNISNSSFVELKHIKFVGCGGHMQPVKRRHIFPSTAAAAIVLHNVKSIRLINISFENSYGHSIFGLNVMGISLFKNITVFLTELRKTRIYSGGITLLYNDATVCDSTLIKTYQKVLIENFEIYNISSINQITWNVYSDTVYDSSVTFAAALGVMFNNHNFSVRIVITHASMSYITSRTGPIVYASYNACGVNNSIIIHNTRINNNINEEEYPNIKISIGIFPHNINGSNRKGNSYFELHNCEFSYNEAQSSNVIIQYANDVIEQGSTHVPFKLNLTTTSVTSNKAVNNFLKTKFIEQWQVSSCFIYIVQCTFIFNNGFTIEVDECSRDVLFKNNKFHNNSASVMERGVLVFDRSHPIFEGYNEFVDNVANVILVFYEYVFLKEGSTINISYNTAALAEANVPPVVKTLIYFETTNTFQLQPCAFQFLSHNIDQLTFNYRVMFLHNKNYSFLIYGALLNSCHWLKNTAFKNLNSSFVYKRVLDFDTSLLTTSISRQKSTIYFCNDANQVEYFKDKLNPIFPGQYIPVHLTLLPPFSYVVVYSMNFTTDKLEYKIPYKPCEMQPYQFKWLKLVQQNCTFMPYKIYSNTFEKCYVSFKTTYPDDSLYIYYVEFMKCPLGFSLPMGLVSVTRV